MRIAFVQDVNTFSVPIGTAIIAGVLRDKGHEVDLFVDENKIDKTIFDLNKFNPQIIGMSVTSGSHIKYIEIAKEIKKRMNVPILWGGPHVTFFPKIIEEDYIDAVCVGEGDEAITEFADTFDSLGGKIPKEVKNFWTKVDGTIYRNGVRPRIKKLDEIVYPARDLFTNKFPILKNHGIKHFNAHRGCPHKCTYCFNHQYNKIYKEQAGDKKVLFSRTPESIVEEILWLKKTEIVKMVNFVDDVFTIDKKWTLRFAEIYSRDCGIPFTINARFDHFDEEIVAALAKANLSLVYAGIESGNEYMRNVIMEREQSLEDIYKTNDLFKKYKIRVLTENVLGGPGETFDMAMETLMLNAKIKPVVANASIFAPYPGMKMTQIAIDKNYFDGDYDKLDTTYYASSVLKFDNPKDENKIYNLRCFFSLLVQHPWLIPVIKPLFNINNKKLFWFIGTVLDGYYIKKGIVYKQTFGEFIGNVIHYFKNYRTSRKLSKESYGVSS